MSESSRFARRVRKEIDEPGLRASIAADVNIAVSTGGSTSSRSTVRVKQGKAARSAAPPSAPDPKETP